MVAERAAALRKATEMGEAGGDERSVRRCCDASVRVTSRELNEKCHGPCSSSFISSSQIPPVTGQRRRPVSCCWAVMGRANVDRVALEMLARSFCPPSSSTSSTSLKMASARSVNPSLPAVSQSCSEVGLELGVLKDELTDQLLIVALL